MSRSRKFTIKKPHEELSKENAKLTQEISDLEDALALHQRYVDEDRNSVPGIIRQEVGGSRWQYGGGGKLRTFRSKDDLVETQGAGGHKSSRDSKHGFATTSRKAEENPSQEAGPANATGPRCLNADAAVRSKAMTEVSSSKKNSAKSAPKKNNKSRHYQQTTWSFGPGKIKPHSEEYNTVMHDLFGEGGFPLERDYSVQSATVGMSLFEEKDETDISEMKSKVLQRASAVLIMRPRSANASQAQLLHRQKAMLGSGRASKLPKGKSQKKLTAAQTDRKALTDNAKSNLDIKLDKHKSNEASRKSSLSDSTKVEKIPAESKKRSDLPLPEKCSELDAAALKKTAVEEKATGSSNNGPAADVKDTDEDVTDILARFSQGADTETKPHHGLFVTNTRRPLSNRSWDKSAVPKPWDKWASLRKRDVNSKSVKSNKPLTADPRMPHSSPKALLKSSVKPSTGKSWQPSSPTGKAATSNEKRPQSAGMPAPRPSWARQLSTEAELPQKSTGHPDLDPQAWNLPVSKRKAVVDWLDKHVNSSREEEPTSPSSSSSSVFDTDAGNALLSANNLAEVTAQAAGVESYEISTRVSAWLSSLGLKNVDVYEQMFAKHQIDMVDVPSLTVPVLQQIGISKLGPVMKIMRGVDRLKAGLSKTTKKLKQLEDFDHPGKFQGMRKRSSGAGENQNSVHSEAATGVLNSRSQADRPVESKESQEGCNMRNSSDKASEEKNMSPAERAENLRSSLQELYRQLAREETSGHRCGEGVLLGNSRGTSPFECTHRQAEGGFSETSTNVPQLTSESDGSQRWQTSQEGRTGQKMRHFPIPAEEAKEGGALEQTKPREEDKASRETLISALQQKVRRVIIHLVQGQNQSMILTQIQECVRRELCTGLHFHRQTRFPQRLPQGMPKNQQKHRSPGQVGQ